MNTNRYYQYPRPPYPAPLRVLAQAPVRRPRLMAGPAPTVPAEWIAWPSTTPQVPCGSQECGDFVVSELKPLNLTRSENVLLALIAGGAIGYFIGRER